MTGRNKTVRAAKWSMALAAALLTATGASAKDRFAAFLFQDTGDRQVGELTLDVMPIVMSTRPDVGKHVVFVDTDQTGLATLQDDVQVKIEGPLLIYRYFGDRVAAPEAARNGAAQLASGTGEPQTFYLLAYVEPAEGREAEFNSFYDATHLPEVLTIPGMQWAQRSTLASQTPGFGAPAYMAVYEFRSFDVAATMAEFGKHMESQNIRPFPEGSMGPRLMAIYAGPAKH